MDLAAVVLAVWTLAEVHYLAGTAGAAVALLLLARQVDPDADEPAPAQVDPEGGP
ncbi:MAG: hypothetical protein V4515_04610 [Chloroflexota bacterium]